MKPLHILFPFFALLTFALNAQQATGELMFLNQYSEDILPAKPIEQIKSAELFVDELHQLEDFEKYKSLKYLTIKSRNYSDSLDVLPEALFYLDSLTYLKLENLRIRKWDLLYTRMAAIPNLTSLSLNGCDGNYLNPQLASLQNLVTLSLFFCHDETDSPYDVLYSLTQLRLLDLSFCGVERLPEGISALKDLESVTLKYNALNELPSDFQYLSKLRYLNLRENKINGFPECLLRLQNLRHLDLSNNRISQLPDSIAQLKRLRVFDLAWNRLDELSDGISQFDSLERFDISMNRFRTIPTVLLGCDALTELYCWGSRLNNNSPVLRLLSYSGAMYFSRLQDSVAVYKDSFPDWNRIFGDNETVQVRKRFLQDVLSSKWCNYRPTPDIEAELFGGNEIMLWELCRWRERKNPIYQEADAAEVGMYVPILPFGARRMTNIRELTIESDELWLPTWRFLGPIARHSEKIQTLKIEDEYMRRVPRSVHKMDQLETLELDCRSLIGLPEWLNDMPRLHRIKIREDVDVPESIKNNRRITITYY